MNINRLVNYERDYHLNTFELSRIALWAIVHCARFGEISNWIYLHWVIDFNTLASIKMSFSLTQSKRETILLQFEAVWQLIFYVQWKAVSKIILESEKEQWIRITYD